MNDKATKAFATIGYVTVCALVITPVVYGFHDLAKRRNAAKKKSKIKVTVVPTASALTD